MSLNKKNITFYIISVMFFILDRFLKFLAINNYFQKPIVIIKDLFKLNFIPNKYIAFSIPLTGVWLNALISILIIGLLFYFFYLYKKNKTQAVVLSFVILGAISNLADRINLSYVIDYLDLKYFTVFNVADAMIVCGITLLLFFNIKNKN